MVITESKIRMIIKEEIKKVLKESAFDDPSTAQYRAVYAIDPSYKPPTLNDLNVQILVKYLNNYFERLKQKHNKDKKQTDVYELYSYYLNSKDNSDLTEIVDTYLANRKALSPEELKEIQELDWNYVDLIEALEQVFN